MVVLQAPTPRSTSRPDDDYGQPQARRSQSTRPDTRIFFSILPKAGEYKGRKDNCATGKTTHNCKYLPKKYLVFPICKNKHWYLVILKNSNSSITIRDKKGDSNMQGATDACQKGEEQETNSVILEDNLSDLKKDFLHGLSIKQESDDLINTPVPEILASIANKLVALVFCSLNQKYLDICDVLKDCLRCEYNFNYNAEINSSNINLKQLQVAVLEQEDGYNCGIHLLHSFKQYFFNNRIFETRVIPTQDSKSLSWDTLTDTKSACRTFRLHWIDRFNSRKKEQMPSVQFEDILEAILNENCSPKKLENKL